MLVSSAPQEKVNVTHASAWCLANALLWELASALRSCAQQSPFELHCVPLTSKIDALSTALQKILLQICMQTELALNFQTHSNLHYPSALEPTWRTAIIQNQLVNLVFPFAFQCREEVFAKGKTTFFSQRRMFSQTRTTTRLATVTAPGFFLCNL